MSDLPKEWVAVRFGRLGDVALTTGVLNRLLQERGLTFRFLTKRAFAPILDRHPAIADIISPNDDELRGKAWLRTARRIARDCAGLGLLDLHGNLRSLLLASLWRGPVRRYPKFALQRRLFAASGGRLCGESLRCLNVPQRYAMAMADGTKRAPAAADVRPMMVVAPEEQAAAMSITAERNVRRPFVAVHPYAAHPAKTWPRERWLHLIELLEREGFDWLIVGRSDMPFAEDVRDLTNATDLRLTAALLQQACVAVGGDSGPMHMATAVGTPVAALFGPTSKEWGFYPSGEDDVVLETRLPCRPCSLHGGSGCAHQVRCMRDISPAAVMKEIVRLKKPPVGDG